MVTQNNNPNQHIGEINTSINHPPKVDDNKARCILGETCNNKIQKHFNLQRMKKRQQAKEFREIVVTKKE